MMQSIIPSSLSRNISSSYTAVAGYKIFCIPIYIYFYGSAQKQFVKTELRVQLSVLHKVPEGKEGNLVYSSARLGHGNQWQNMFVQKEKRDFFPSISINPHGKQC